MNGKTSRRLNNRFRRPPGFRSTIRSTASAIDPSKSSLHRNRKTLEISLFSRELKTGLSEQNTKDRLWRVLENVSLLSLIQIYFEDFKDKVYIDEKSFISLKNVRHTLYKREEGPY